jgi:hypothetical protein
MIELDAETFDRPSALNPWPSEDDWDSIAVLLVSYSWAADLRAGEQFREPIPA